MTRIVITGSDRDIVHLQTNPDGGVRLQINGITIEVANTVNGHQAKPPLLVHEPVPPAVKAVRRGGPPPPVLLVQPGRGNGWRTAAAKRQAIREYVAMYQPIGVGDLLNRLGLPGKHPARHSVQLVIYRMLAGGDLAKHPDDELKERGARLILPTDHHQETQDDDEEA